MTTPHEGYHRTYGSFASNSPVTDGARLFAFFGSRGLFAYDLEGALLWQKYFGVRMKMDQAFGEGPRSRSTTIACCCTSIIWTRDFW